VFGPRVMPYLQEGRFSQFFRRFQGGIIVTSLTAYVGAVAGRGAITHWLLPSSFSQSSSVAVALLPGALAGLTTFPLTITLLMFVRPRFLFAMDCIGLPIVVALYWLVIPRYGALGTAWVTSLFNIARASVAQVAAWVAASANDRKVKAGFPPVSQPSEVLLGA